MLCACSVSCVGILKPIVCVGQPDIDNMLDDPPSETRLVYSHTITFLSTRRLHPTPPHPEGIAKLYRCRHLLRMSHDNSNIPTLADPIHRYRFDIGPFLSAKPPRSICSPPTTLSDLHRCKTGRNLTAIDKVSVPSTTIAYHAIHPCPSFHRPCTTTGDLLNFHPCTIGIQEL